MTETAQKIIAAVSDTLGLRPQQIAEKSGLPIRTVCAALANMRRYGLVIRLETGEWRAASRPLEGQQKEML